MTTKINLSNLDEPSIIADYMSFACNLNLLQALSLYGLYSKTNDEAAKSMIYVNLRQTYINCIQDLGNLARVLINRQSQIEKIKTFNKKNKGKPKEDYPEFPSLIMSISSENNDDMPSIFDSEDGYKEILRKMGLLSLLQRSRLKATGRKESHIQGRMQEIPKIFKILQDHRVETKDIFNKIKHGKSVVSSNILLHPSEQYIGPVSVVPVKDGWIADGQIMDAQSAKIIMNSIAGVTALQKDIALFYFIKKFPEKIDKYLIKMASNKHLIESLMKSADYSPPWI